MEPIPKAIVDKTWHEVAAFSPDRAKKEMMKIGNSQPELLAFVTESAPKMGREVRELAIYMFLVVYRMFQKTHGKIRRISSEEIIKCYEHNEGLMERLEGAHDKFLDRVASLQASRQPHVVNYVVDALMEDEGKDAVTLTNEQKGFLYLLLKTVVDVLDQKNVES